MNLLFTQTQSMLTHALETFNKFLQENPIEIFVEEKNGNIYHSEIFPQKKAELVDLHNSLNLQFKGAQFAFESVEFRNEVKRSFMKAKESKLGWYVKKGTFDEETEQSGPPTSWYCTRCTFWNDNNLNTQCSMCGLDGRPEV